MADVSTLSDRVAAIAESATLAVDAKAKALKAAGRPVIGFGAGEPDFPTPPHVVAAAAAAATDPANHRYTPAAGLPALREAIAADSTAQGRPVSASQVVVTNGGKQAIFSTMATLLNPGDEVLLQAPFWVTYPEVIRLFGGVPVVIPTDETTGYRLTVDALEAARTPRTRMIVHVSPANPTGAVYEPAAVAAIGEWAAAHGILVMSDDIYRHLVYDTVFTPLCAAAPAADPLTVVVDGVAKAYAMTGWRVGWLIAPPEIAAGAVTLQSHMTSNVNNVAQQAAIAALTGPQEVIAEMRAAFDRRRRLMVGLLNDIDGVIAPEPAGAFYAYPSIKGLIGRNLGGRLIDSSLTFADVALETANVAVVPGEAFGTPGYLRLSYAMGDDEIREGIGRLGALVAAG
ncbi:MAG: pyridoxal phosphate-dependent aminotransferase [Actinomycetales bacterium]|nr:pyridoxal phosphate-dependent aminotransferase [Actinomycetales bacterium]